MAAKAAYDVDVDVTISPCTQSHSVTDILDDLTVSAAAVNTVVSVPARADSPPDTLAACSTDAAGDLHYNPGLFSSTSALFCELPQGPMDGCEKNSLCHGLNWAHFALATSRSKVDLTSCPVVVASRTFAPTFFNFLCKESKLFLQFSEVTTCTRLSALVYSFILPLAIASFSMLKHIVPWLSFMMSFHTCIHFPSISLFHSMLKKENSDKIKQLHSKPTLLFQFLH